MVKPCQEKTFKKGNIYCVYVEHLFSEFTPEMLSSTYWQQQNSIIGTAQGRGTTWFIENQHQQWVLRHYYRGGLIGKFNKDKYLFNAFNSTRAAREFSLLKIMQELQLPVPDPVAFRIIKNGLFYQADLLSSRIQDANDLVYILGKQRLTEEIWLTIGATIKRFHDSGIYHHDLNIHNILLDKNNKCWLIDFDRGEQRTVSNQWQKANLARLLRSFRKELLKQPVFHWQEEDWQLLLEGYLSN
ncbi:MAG: 3-deoxy-D-manno-octulosonic acid kinase [Alteromonadaceae bacterium]|nr:3-deoxy-D-manno-octulosonic acid kinase [Alteromonadaceae bacterium]